MRTGHTNKNDWVHRIRVWKVKLDLHAFIEHWPLNVFHHSVYHSPGCRLRLHLIRQNVHRQFVFVTECTSDKYTPLIKNVPHYGRLGCLVVWWKRRHRSTLYYARMCCVRMRPVLLCLCAWEFVCVCTRHSLSLFLCVRVCRMWVVVLHVERACRSHRPSLLHPSGPWYFNQSHKACTRTSTPPTHHSHKHNQHKSPPICLSDVLGECVVCQYARLRLNQWPRMANSHQPPLSL